MPIPIRVYEQGYPWRRSVGLDGAAFLYVPEGLYGGPVATGRVGGVFLAGSSDHRRREDKVR
jgi:hypothetical protein